MTEAEEIIRKLLDIAHLAMPDTYFASDSRVQQAKEWLVLYTERPWAPKGE